jgi:hypothetical protein
VSENKFCKHPKTVSGRTVHGDDVWHMCVECHAFDPPTARWLTCSKCTARVYETYKDGLCSYCEVETQMAKKLTPLDKVLGIKVVNGKPVIPMSERKNGDWWALPKSNSPMMTQQWGYQGSGKAPYVVTQYKNKCDAQTTNEGWACGCPAFTQHSPRVPCKHVLKIMKETKFPSMWLKAGEAAKVAVATIDDAEAKAFEQWKRDQAAAKAETAPAVGEKKLNLFGNTGRKFR